MGYGFCRECSNDRAATETYGAFKVYIGACKDLGEGDTMGIYLNPVEGPGIYSE